MTESHSSQSSSSPGMTIDLRPMIEDVSQVMTKHITNILTGVIGEYTTYKETHDTIMGLPCVRKLQERIVELESGLGGRRVKGTNDHSAADDITASASGSGSREDEVAQLQSAIAEMNRYIIALESKVDVKTACSSSSSVASNRGTLEVVKEDEESVRLEIHEEDAECDNHRDESSGQTFTVSSRHKNVIVSATDAEEEAAEADAEAEAEAEADDAEADEAEEEADAEAEAAEEAEAEDAEAEEEADEEAADEEAEEAEEEAEEAADEEEAEAEEPTEEAADEEEADEEAADEEAEEAEEEAEEAEEEAEEAEEAEEEAEEAEEAEAEEEAEEAEAEEAEAEEAEIEVSEVKIKGKTYFTTDAVNGIIYACVDDDVGDEVGVFKNGVAVFTKAKK